ncbi:hypothetical protein NA56DRAFT_707250 [Hyaloscypha hepaticicola]|uniref:Uncharacterized protein n=1 Tax=Hyaloscypha hepaticicola TaxID=2082293 RepID=A0A2J6PV97_9HELO|nr:hypothetical protein NA56DRAFT_707250 [Hyaloscypha hepaticicola]
MAAGNSTVATPYSSNTQVACEQSDAPKQGERVFISRRPPTREVNSDSTEWTGVFTPTPPDSPISEATHTPRNHDGVRHHIGSESTVAPLSHNRLAKWQETHSTFEALNDNKVQGQGSFPSSGTVHMKYVELELNHKEKQWVSRGGRHEQGTHHGYTDRGLRLAEIA